MTIWPDISFQDRIDTSEFRIHERAHITVNDDSCRGCTTRECVVACLVRGPVRACPAPFCAFVCCVVAGSEYLA